MGDTYAHSQHTVRTHVDQCPADVPNLLQQEIVIARHQPPSTRYKISDRETDLNYKSLAATASNFNARGVDVSKAELAVIRYVELKLAMQQRQRSEAHRPEPTKGILMNFYPPLSRIAGRYEVASRPLLGGMGVVYLCYDHQEDRPVALKTFKPEYLPDRDARERFLREGRTWVDLGRHPHVVHAYGVRHIGDGREVYLVLEQIAKEQGRPDASLRSWLTPGHPLPAADALLIALQIVRGLKHASERVAGFVHRDLKPENVLVGADRLTGWAFNRVRVTDFGLAASLQGQALPKSEGNVDVRQTQLTHGLVGTPLYMAPEQWAGEPLSAQTDMYALGLILYEMLHGERAVVGQSRKELERAHRAGVRPWRTNVPAIARTVTDTCLRLAALDRYNSWSEVEQVLVRAYGDVSGQAAPAVEAQQALARDERVTLGWAQSALGAAYLDLGKADAAVKYFTRAKDVGVAEGDRALARAGLNHLGLAYAALGDARRAIGLHEQALVIGREIGDRHGEGTALGNLGLAYAALGDARRAIVYHEQALVIGREIGDRPGEGAALGNLGLAHADLGDARRAIVYHEQALTVMHAIGDRRGEGNELGNLGSAYAALGDARRAIEYDEQALTVMREIGDRHGEGTALGNLGAAYGRLGDARRAIEYDEQALTVMRWIGDRRGEGAALGNLGLAYARLGDAQRAIGLYEQALTVMREIGDRRGEGAALGNLGLAYAALGDARRAIELYEQALVIGREIGDRGGEGAALGNLGAAYGRLGDTRRAIALYEQKLVIVREIGDRGGEGAVLGNMGNAYANLGDTRRAIAYHEQALEIHREIGDANGVATDLFNLAGLQQQQGDTARALPLAQAAARIWLQIGHAEYAQRAQQLVATLQGGAPSAENTGQAAFEAFQRANSADAMRQAVAQYPILITPQFIAVIERVIVTQVAPELKPAFQERLATLKRIAQSP